MSEKEMLERQNDLITRAEEILDSAKAEQRELNDEEIAEITSAKEEVRRIIETLTLLEEVRSMEKFEEKSVNKEETMEEREHR